MRSRAAGELASGWLWFMGILVQSEWPLRPHDDSLLHHRLRRFDAHDLGAVVNDDPLMGCTSHAPDDGETETQCPGATRNKS